MDTKIIKAKPNSEFLIKSISEQGYSLETALSDLIDNSISAEANKIEILTEHKDDQTFIFITDNGFGMTKEELSSNLQFPSRDMELKRKETDLGRFGLGLKTASFSQTRKFTVISRKRNSKEYAALTWDVAHLRKTGEWEIIVNTEEDICRLLKRYKNTSDNHLEKFLNYEPNTIIVWQGLKNFDNYIDSNNHHKHLNDELTTTTSEHLSIVFHEFMEQNENPLKIRLNNVSVRPFNPFKSKSGSIARKLEPREMLLGNDVLKMDGFVLPVSASENTNDWSTSNKSLLDMEGIYVYRGNRIIFFGGWNGVIRKQAKLKLARLKIQVGNMNDEKLQLNVAKSKISIPYELRMGVLRYISDLKQEAIREYNNRGLKSSSSKGINSNNDLKLLAKQSTTKGPVYSINLNYPFVKMVSDELNDETLRYFKILLRKINSVINKQRYVDDNSVSIQEDISKNEIINTTNKLLASGLTTEEVYEVYLKGTGINKGNLPNELKKILV
ncbi:ATP-binding protein [Winogradskyella damuponensis]|uniref:ATP-binding protein n=1 Tax=Winogradskyella damuponensis TaxID=943939 RepID=A0ABP8CNY2_9FLAO